MKTRGKFDDVDVDYAIAVKSISILLHCAIINSFKDAFGIRAIVYITELLYILSNQSKKNFISSILINFFSFVKQLSPPKTKQN